MFQHSVEYQWMTYFFIYSFLGWIFESTYVSLKERRWVNRGFLKGPFLPIYGSGAVMMLVVSRPFADDPVLIYIAGFIGATLLELVTGAAIEAVFKVRYWDYSYQKLNYKGYICLSSSVAWGFFTIGMTRWLHPAVCNLIAAVPETAGSILFAVVFTNFSVDVVLSVREAVDMRDVLIRMESVRHEIQILKKRADVIAAVVDDEIKGITNSTSEALGINQLLKSMEEQIRQMDIQRRIFGNPTMVSSRYSLPLETLKDVLSGKSLIAAHKEKEDNGGVI